MPSAGFWWAQIDNAAKDRAIDDAAKAAAEKFAQGFQTLLKSAGFKPAPPLDRLRAYRNRTPEVWAALRAEFPGSKDVPGYAQDMDDWRELEASHGALLDAQTNPEAIEGEFRVV